MLKHWQKPGLCDLLTGIFKGIKRHGTSTRFWVGIVFLLTNVPIGYTLLGIGSLMAAVTKNPKWAIIGTIGYVISWGMLLLSFILLGKKSFKTAHQVVRGKFKAWRRLRKDFS